MPPLLFSGSYLFPGGLNRLWLPEETESEASGSPELPELLPGTFVVRTVAGSCRVHGEIGKSSRRVSVWRGGQVRRVRYENAEEGVRNLNVDLS